MTPVVQMILSLQRLLKLLESSPNDPELLAASKSLLTEIGRHPRPPAIPQPGPQTRFHESTADIAIYGGAAGGGKTFALLMEALRHVHNPRFGALIFRETYSQITKQGGLWDESMDLYPRFGGVPNVSKLRWRFPDGGRIGFEHFERDSRLGDWRGAQIPLIEIDQLEQFSSKRFWGLVERNRSACGVQPYMRASCNPRPGWLREMLRWWIGSDGFPVPSRSGVLRWFMRIEEELIWADTAAELQARYPSEHPPQSMTFILSKVTDNQILLKKNPRYQSILRSLHRVERMRQEEGNWDVTEADGIFEVENLQVVDDSPRSAARVRYWDKAGTEGGGDESAGVLIAKSADGLFWVEDVVVGKLSSLQRNKLISQTAQLDKALRGRVVTWVEQEPGSGGKESAEISIRELAGHEVYAERVTGDKLTRAGPLAAQIEAGNVRLVAGDWNAGFIEELRACPNGKWNRVDASSGAFNKVAGMMVQSGTRVHVPSGTSVLDQFPPGTF